MFFVALPLAQSSPFPTPRDGGWISDAPASFRLASAGESIAVRLTEGAPDNHGSELRDMLGEQAAIEWEAMIGPAGVIDVAPAAVSALRESGDGSATQITAVTVEELDVTAAITPGSEPVAKRAASPMDEVDDYLWEVYQRVPVKKDRSGDFTWKDPAAAKRFGVSMPAYVIRGMDPDFREQLYHAGKAMDAEGLRWSILSAFRDDYRQGIASGFKARTGNSLHGGSRATGGYGHGRAIDIISADGDHRAVWRWIDRNRGKYGFSRPMPARDPAHIQSAGDWRRIAAKLRDGRVRIAEQATPEPVTTALQSTQAKTKVARSGR